ncbi:MAG: hypothetical protein BWY62_00188 [Firmicutes bacterium ADurb.Bin356]|nr:MAG: hypothetical protein BWY62_00188 [Firmicutes bacterium ADurb.Bin356]
MIDYSNSIGVQVPSVLLPREGTDYSKWAVVACDQYTSQPEYWENAKAFIDGAPSSLNLILPEAYLAKPGEAQMIASIKRTMAEYLAQNVLEEKEPGFVLVKRKTGEKERLGLVMALDLEQYDYNKGSSTLIRASEGTIVDRIPPRLRIREGAPIELPHILVLIDDPNCTVIEPLLENTKNMELLYECELMLGGGHVSGHLVKDEVQIARVLRALNALKDNAAFEEKYGKGRKPLLFAMGDGNHSFATAKASWEAIKKTLPASELETHPARYALVEVENVHDEGIVFEPIHRVLFNAKPEEALEMLFELLKEENGSADILNFKTRELLDLELAKPSQKAQLLPFFYGSQLGMFHIPNPVSQLSVGTLQTALDRLIELLPDAEVDYIHGEDVVLDLSSRKDTLGFLLPAMKKSELFPTIIFDGALPRKTFSMGEANEKRYYIECRRILP